MRLAVTCELENEAMPLDFRRKILSFLKYALSNYDKKSYEYLYGKGKTEPKDFCFSVYFPEAKISGQGINVRSKKLIINISSYDIELGINLYNSLIRQQWRTYDLSTFNKIKEIINMNLKKEKIIKNDKVQFHTLSPIVIRDHNKELGTDWYLTFEDNNYEKILKRNLKSELINKFDEDVTKDIDNLKISDISMKKIIAKSYDINIPCAIGNFALEGKQYLLNYFYKAGLGSKRSLGFSLLDIFE